jgi:hypothetical protein
MLTRWCKFQPEFFSGTILALTTEPKKQPEEADTMSADAGLLIGQPSARGSIAQASAAGVMALIIPSDHLSSCLACRPLLLSIFHDLLDIAMARNNPDGKKTPLTLPNHPRIKGPTLRAICRQSQIRAWQRPLTRSEYTIRRHGGAGDQARGRPRTHSAYCGTRS